MTGESYAGHYVPAFAKTILEHSSGANFSLTAIAVGDGLTDAVNQFTTYASVAYVNGFLDEQQRKELDYRQGKIYEALSQGHYGEGEDLFGDIPSMVSEMAGEFDVYNWRKYARGG